MKDIKSSLKQNMRCRGKTLHYSLLAFVIAGGVCLNLRCSSPGEPDYVSFIAFNKTPVTGIYVTTENYPDGTGEVLGNPSYSLGSDGINAFPNPYLGRNYSELSRFTHYITFNHLPDTVTFVIVHGVSLIESFAKNPLQAGFSRHGESSTIVQRLIKSDHSQFLQWNFKDEWGVTVQSGLYRAYFFGPTLNGVRWIDLSVTITSEYLDRY